MEKLINLNSVVSLYQITEVRVTGILWNTEIPRIVASILGLAARCWLPSRRASAAASLKDNRDFLYYEQGGWGETWMSQKSVELKIDQLLLSNLMTKELLPYVRIMALRIWDWCRELMEILPLEHILLHKICWTPHGLVDKQRTVELLLKDDESMEITKQFELARIYCIEDCFFRLLRKLKKNQIQMMRGVINYHKDGLERLLLKENFYNKGWRNGMESIFQQRSFFVAFQYAAAFDHTVGTNYFLQKLTPAEKESYLVDTTVFLASKVEDHMIFYDFPKQILLILFSHMNATQQLETLKRSPVTMMQCFLYWPWQSFFIKVANCMWDFLLDSDFLMILLRMVEFCPKGWDKHDLPNLFKKFWLPSPADHKRYVMTNIDSVCEILDVFIELGDEQNIMLILDSATDDERHSILFSELLLKTCFELVRNFGYWLPIKALMRKCICTKQKLLQFKKKFEGIFGFDGFQEERDTLDQLVEEIMTEKFCSTHYWFNIRVCNC